MCINTIFNIRKIKMQKLFEFSPETISEYRNTHLLVPCAYTPNEAFRMLDAGAPDWIDFAPHCHFFTNSNGI